MDELIFILFFEGKIMDTYIFGILFVVLMSVVDFFMAIKAFRDNRTRHGVLMMLLAFAFMIGAIVLIVIR
ncbi:hypothetical protein FC62_GL000673 [Amylolactobacillus amylotrophicus DSM 20534]|uniref:Uncharacterized protein n=3 Tax=Lactobacillaceae TaxID=33958 RepID=A0A0R1YI63_9LACO|nr:hypothetical protein FC62_GL000673 [Amylolactobacillus amylotrophicus DSM 20534]KRM42168.1 hypothetical protein FD40_GL000952 [Amylolactobacillus amylophilus DSM 20533 = JCM 1125]